MVFFSVSMPVYNAANYLDKSISSVISQSEKDYELILVDDGSTDGSGDICKRWEAQYPGTICYIRKENSGSLLTRRRCLQESRGRYIYIMDADDYLCDVDALAKVRRVIEKTGCDLAFFDCTKDEKTKAKAFDFPFANEEIFEGDRLNVLYEEVFKNKKMNTLWNKVFSRDIVDWDYDYNPYAGISNGTDFFQMVPLLFSAKKAVYIDEVLYFYRTTQGSIVHSYKPSVYYSIKSNHFRLCECIKASDYAPPDLERRLATRFLRGASTALFKIRMKGAGNAEERCRQVRNIGEDPMFRECYEKGDLSRLSLSRRCLVNLLYKKQYLFLSAVLPMFRFV